MKARFAILLMLISSVVFGQQMEYIKGKVYYEGNSISLKEAHSISLSQLSNGAAKKFFTATEFPVRRIQIGLGAFGGILLYAALEEALIGRNEDAVVPFVMGSGTIAGGVLLELKRRNNIKSGVNLFNDDLKYRDKRLKAEELRLQRIEKQRQEEKASEQRRKNKEKNRIDRFHATLAERLSQPLNNIEGVYKSIDQGEQYEYDIAILKSLIENKYIGLVLESTDPTVRTGYGLLSLIPTAQPNLYFVNYQDKAGNIFKNKTAELSGGVLVMGMKSFVKMYPSENDKRRFNEIDPLFDWESSGSGVLINKEGYVVTNNHVASGAKRLRISFQNDSLEYNAVIVSQNEQTDVAVLKIQDERFYSDVKAVSWSTEFKLGQKVFTLGYPISDKMSNNVKVVDGIVSGENGRKGNSFYFQTTLPVWYGNSGGPCFNSKGEILGLATQILFDRGEKVDNVAYVTRTENILNLANEIIPVNNPSGEEESLEKLIDKLIPYSVFIKVNY